jgi:hypothetical protein
MKPIYLYLPVCVLGIPMLVGLLVASGQSDETSTPAEANRQLQNQVAQLDEDLEKSADPLPDSAGMADLARKDPVRFLENCIRYYDRDVHSYHLIMQKQERVPTKLPIEKRKLQKKEVIEVYFKEKPHSVFMHWLEGERLTDRCLYVEGENDNMILVHPAGLAGKFVSFVKRKVDGPEAQESGRYTLNMFGIKFGTLRTLTFAKKAKEEGKLNMDYLGVDGEWHKCGPEATVSIGEQSVAAAGNRVCYILRRHYAEEENDGVLALQFFIDKQNWLQVGSIVEGKFEEPNAKKRYLIGEYYFRDIELNPKFAPDQFKEAAVTKK